MLAESQYHEHFLSSKFGTAAVRYKNKMLLFSSSLTCFCTQLTKAEINRLDISTACANVESNQAQYSHSAEHIISIHHI